MKYKALAAAIALAPLNLYALEGKVVDDSGAPIAGASVETEATREQVITDDQGHFSFEAGVSELHIAAPGYSHRIIQVGNNAASPLVVTLTESVIEQVDVIGLPIHASIIESAIPVTVLSGEELRRQQAATLGDSLESQPGVNTSFHGNVSSTPVIRGLSGPRVLITQNGLDVSDVSRVGPDHAVASEVSTAQQVEILRGPGTLFYGSGAIGGVVNVVDQRVPNNAATEGEVLASYDSVNHQYLGAFNGKTALQSWAFYADAFWRDADNYESPVAPQQEEHEHDEGEEEHDEHGESREVANSAEESSGVTLGTSYLFDKGFIGFAAERIDREYGIPGHSHGHEEEEEGEQAEEESVFADLEQERYQLQSEFDFDSPWLRSLHTRAAYTDYQHAEIENGAVGTLFSNQTTEVRMDVFHQAWQQWEGGLNFHYKFSEVAAEGEEAFTPPSESKTLAAAFMEEKHFGDDVLLQFGARVERVSINADNVLLPAIELHGHEEEEGEEEHEHEHEHESEETRVFAVDHEFTPLSVSLAAVWDFSPGYNIGVAFSHAERAPSAAELLSFGPHIGTRTYEVGALFALHQEDEENHFELSDADFDLESSNNIDLSLRKFEGNLGIILNAFFNKVDNYYYQSATGLYAESAHNHDHEEEEEHEGEEHEDEHTDELPVYLFAHGDAEFYGLEAQAIWQINSQWQSAFFSDFVHAELSNGEYLPRTPPLRVGAEIDFTHNRLSASLSWIHYAEQDKVAPLETPTEGYDMLDAYLSYRIPFNDMDLAFFIKAENLTDTEARVHTSFIKDVAPRPGRNLSLGFRGSF